MTDPAAPNSGISILNDVLGPVMRGPSSSHTAASYHIGQLVAALLGAPPAKARITFDPGGSYGQVYRQQGVDRGFAMGLLGLPLTDVRFFQSLEIAESRGMALSFEVSPLMDPDHPNTTDIRLQAADGRTLDVRARSIGGGAVEITNIDGWPVSINGQTYEVLVDLDYVAELRVRELLYRDGNLLAEPDFQIRYGRILLQAKLRHALSPEMHAAIHAIKGVERVREAPPVAFVKQGPALFQSAAAMIDMAEARGCSLGRAALAYEAALLGISEEGVLVEMARRVDLMRAAVSEGLGARIPEMQLLSPTAGRIFRAEAMGKLAIGGLHTRAAARALAAMQINSGMGVVCAAPTGGSSGVLPGVLVTLMEERAIDREQATLAALAAGAVGVIIGTRATFAAEIAGCQVEIGAAGAMAAAAVIEAAGGTPQPAADAAAISFQNTMGSVCDLVQGIVEIPCHTRNAVAASSAFVCADLIMGGYLNLIPLDETIDAVLAVGKMLPSELRVTSRGGLAVTPSALKLQRRK
ncbi:MAG: L-serine ammonia-lyase, iron-sulfur-dependent, subunit alpha [Acidobacteriota bacterium]